MKRNKLYILASMLVICGFITVMLPSCSKKTASNTTTNSAQAPGNGQKSGNGQQPGGGNMSTQMKKGINKLVSKGTITQAQGKKILAALTSQSSNGQGGAPTNGKKPSKPSGSNKSMKKPSGTKPSSKGGGNAPGGSALTKLVKNKVITQKQADAVQKAIFGNMQGGQGGSSQGGSDSSSQQS